MKKTRLLFLCLVVVMTVIGVGQHAYSLQAQPVSRTPESSVPPTTQSSPPPLSFRIAEGETRCTRPSCCDQKYVACMNECKGLTGDERIVCRHECTLDYNACMSSLEQK
jgi:hypothetical protein